MNYILTAILTTLLLYQAYQYTTYQTPPFPPQTAKITISLPKDKVVEVKNTRLLTESIVKQQVSRLRVSSIKFIGVGFSKDRIYALIDNSGKARVLMIGDKVAGSKVISITTTELHIEGYKKIYFQRPKGLLSAPEPAKAPKATVQSQPHKSSKVKRNLRSRSSIMGGKATVGSTSPAKIGKYVVLKSLVSEVLASPTSISKYFILKKEISGISILPKPNYTNLYNSIGFRIGDRIIKVNDTSVNSIGILIGLSSITSANEIKVLVQNAGKYRLLNVNLLKVYKN